MAQTEPLRPLRSTLPSKRYMNSISSTQGSPKMLKGSTRQWQSSSAWTRCQCMKLRKLGSETMYTIWTKVMTTPRGISLCIMKFPRCILRLDLWSVQSWTKAKLLLHYGSLLQQNHQHIHVLMVCNSPVHKTILNNAVLVLRMLCIALWPHSWHFEGSPRWICSRFPGAIFGQNVWYHNRLLLITPGYPFLAIICICQSTKPLTFIW